MNTENLFIRASREKFRFPSSVGELTTEQLWDLPLTSERKANLNDVAKSINAGLKSVEESFVGPSTDPQRQVLEAKLEIVKAIIATRQEESRVATERAAKAARRQQILDALAQSDQKELSNASREDLMKMLKETES